MPTITLNARICQILRLDLLPLIVCLCLEISIVHIFFNFHKGVRAHCFLFGQINEVKRILYPGPSFVCNGHILYSIFVCVILIWLIKWVYNLSSFIFKSTVSKVLAFIMSIWFLVDIIILWQGLNHLCKSIISSTECSSELFHNFDFRAFKPKYMKGWGGYLAMNCCLHLQVGVLFLWLAFIVMHTWRFWRLKSTQKESNGSFSNTTCNNNAFQN